MRRPRGVGDLRPELSAGAERAGPEPSADPAGKREPPVKDTGQHGEERGAHPRDQRKHLQGRLALLPPLHQLLLPVPSTLLRQILPRPRVPSPEILLVIPISVFILYDPYDWFGN